VDGGLIIFEIVYKLHQDGMNVPCSAAAITFRHISGG